MFPTERLLSLYDMFNGREMLKNFCELKERSCADIDEIRYYQLSALKSILNYALDHSFYYKKMLSRVDLRMRPDRIINFEQIPLLHKSQIRDHLNELISSCYMNTKDICFDHTGGSCGQPLKFAYDSRYKDFRWAMIYFNLHQVGYRFGDCHGFVYGSHYDSKKQYSLRQRLQSRMMNSFSVNAFFLNDRDIHLFLKKTVRKKPKFLIGYASALLRVAKYARENRFKIRLDFIESTAEYLSAENKRFIEEVFDSHVFDRYGCREVGNIAHECRFKKGMHINWQSVFVEVVNKGAYPWLGDDYGDIVITSLKNKGMPLIRYFLGDIGRIDHSACECGLKGPLLYLGGCREGDLLFAKNGSVVSSPALTLIYKDLQGIEGIQFIQPARDELMVRMVRNGEPHDTDNEIIHRLKKLFGREMNINLQYVEHIGKESSGKYRIAKRLFNLNENPLG